MGRHKRNRNYINKYHKTNNLSYRGIRQKIIKREQIFISIELQELIRELEYSFRRETLRIIYITVNTNSH